MLIYPTKMWWDENLSLVEKEEISATNKIKVKKKKKKKDWSWNNRISIFLAQRAQEMFKFEISWKTWNFKFMEVFHETY